MENLDPPGAPYDSVRPFGNLRAGSEPVEGTPGAAQTSKEPPTVDLL